MEEIASKNRCLAGRERPVCVRSAVNESKRNFFERFLASGFPACGEIRSAVDPRQRFGRECVVPGGKSFAPSPVSHGNASPLGCGKATSSIFLAREFGVEAWAADADTSPSENRKRAVALGCEANVFPMRVDAHSLPFAKEFFDAVIAIDSFLYYGTDDRYLNYLVQFIKRGGFIGIVDIGFAREIRSPEEVPDFLRALYAKHWTYVHSIAWWRRHWEKTGLVDVQ
jgi:Methyltransferase domain